jgi:hypothetical protein
MESMNTHDFPQPLRLAVGSHRKGSAFACAMNIIAWETQTTITDFPDCADHAVARMVQHVNDRYCTHTTNVEIPRKHPSCPCPSCSTQPATLLCEQCSLPVLDLAHRTVNTAVAEPDYAAWGVELLDEMRPLVSSKIAGQLSRLRGSAEESAKAQDILALAQWTAELTTVESVVVDFALAHIDIVRSEVHRGREIASLHVNAWLEHGHRQGDRSLVLDAAHRAIDAWERVSGCRAPEPAPERVVAALTKMEAAAA